MSNRRSIDPDDSYYEVIGVDPTASTERIKHEWRQQIKTLKNSSESHPDEYEQLLDAGEVLTNIKKRHWYNQLGHETFISNCGRRGNNITDDIQHINHPPNSSQQSAANSTVSESEIFTQTAAAAYTQQNDDADTHPSPQYNTPGNSPSNSTSQSEGFTERATQASHREGVAQLSIDIKPTLQRLVTSTVLIRVTLLGVVTTVFLFYTAIDGSLGTGQGLLWLFILALSTVLSTRVLELRSTHTQQSIAETEPETRTETETEPDADPQRIVPSLSTTRFLLWSVFFGLTGLLSLLKTSRYNFKQTLVISFDLAQSLVPLLITGVVIFLFSGIAVGRINSHYSRPPPARLPLPGIFGILGILTTFALLSTSLLSPNEFFTSVTGVNQSPWPIAGSLPKVGVSFPFFVTFFFACLIATIVLFSAATIPCVMIASHRHSVNGHYIVPSIWETSITVLFLLYFWAIVVIHTGTTGTVELLPALTTNSSLTALLLLLSLTVFLFLVRSHIEPHYSNWRDKQVSGDYTEV